MPLRAFPALCRGVSVLAAVVAIAAAVGGGGCQFNAPLDRASLASAQLRAIDAVYSRAVQAARGDATTNWQSGWTGNLVVNLSPGQSHRGLCWQWRDLVYREVGPTVRSVGWEARGLVVNWGSWLEHSVVIVYDPAVVSPWTLWEMPRPRPVWVLDAWVSGRPDIFQLDQWLGNNPDFVDAATVIELPSQRVISQRGRGQ